MAHKVWDLDVVGVLASEEYVERTTGRQPVFINNQDSLQFYIQVISETPSDLTDMKLVTAYTSDIAPGGFLDPETDPDSRINALVDFLSTRFVVFKPQLKTIGMGQEVYGATDVRLHMRTAKYDNQMTFTPVPLFREEKHGTMVEFETKLMENKYLGRTENVPHGEDDTPLFIIWQDKHLDNYVYGIIESHGWLNTSSSFRFQFKGDMKKIEFGESWEEEAIQEEDIMFISNNVDHEIREALQDSQPLPPPPAAITEPEETIRERTEVDFLRELFSSSLERGFLFDERDLINFHTAMKTSNLVILAGMSGTGKSKLVEVYSKSLGLTAKQFNMIPVRPYWSDDADLLGYVDTKNNIYRPGDTGLIEALKTAEGSSQLHIVCFDEMNLARVEHYFSQFLSVLESSPPRKIRLYNDELANRLYNAADYPPTINIGDNVMFVGTVNLDESTHHFSDKVLDRANVITLNVLPFHKLRELKVQTVPPGSWTAKDFYGFKNRSESVQLSDREIGFLEQVHLMLHENNYQQGIGFRIVRQIDMYIKNLPEQNYLSRADAFDLQFAQRIMTKIRGSEEDLRPIVIDESLSRLFDEYSDISEFSISRRALNQKAKELKLHGFTF